MLVISCGGWAQDFGIYGSTSVVDYVNYLDQTATGLWSGVDVSLAATPGTAAEGEDVLLRAPVIPGFAWDPGIFGTTPVFALVRPGDPSGTVTFREGSTILGTVDLNSVTDSAGKVTSQASLTLSTLSPGEHRITADYSGDGSYAAGSSPELPVTIYIQTTAPPAVSTPVVPPMVSFNGPTATGRGMSKVEFSGGGEECSFSKSAFLPVPDNVGATVGALKVPDAKVSFPHGLVDFTASGCTDGATLNFTFTLPSATPAGVTLYKHGSTFDDTTPHWYTYPANFDGKIVTFSITDGGRAQITLPQVEGV